MIVDQSRLFSAEARASSDIETWRWRVWNCTANSGDATCDELEQRLHGSHQTVSATMHALKKDDLLLPVKELIRDDEGNPVVRHKSRRTRTGRRAGVWKVNPHVTFFEIDHG
jgi:hypothetical protein